MTCLGTEVTDARASHELLLAIFRTTDGVDCTVHQLLQQPCFKMGHNTIGHALAHPVRNPSSHVVWALESYFGFGTWNLDRHDIFWGKQEQFVLVLGTSFNTAGCMLDVYSLQLIGDEASIAPCFSITPLIRLYEHTTVFLPCLSSELIVVVLDTATGNFQQFINGKVGKLKLIGEARL